MAEGKKKDASVTAFGRLGSIRKSQGSRGTITSMWMTKSIRRLYIR